MSAKIASRHVHILLQRRPLSAALHLPTVLLLVVAMLVTLTGGTAAARPARSAATAPWVGLIAPSDAQAATLRGTAVTRVVVNSGWNVVVPRPGVVNTVALGQLKARVLALQSAGFAVVLDPGLQYTPSWVFDLPGQTRFVNQYGETWTAGLSEDVPNAVFNPAVRAAQASYLAVLGAAFTGVTFADVRVGGLLSGELRYPLPVYGAHRDGLWMYDAAAQAASPRPGWRPGTGTRADANAALDYYFASLTGYMTWLMQTTLAAFPKTEQQVLFPSWGVRPGMVAAAVNAGLRNTTVGEVNGLIASGLDWDRQVAAMAATGIKAMAYTTWLDAPVQGTTLAQIVPAAYLARIAKPYGIAVGGENTGRGGVAALQTSLQRAKTLGLVCVVYMSGPFLQDGSAGMDTSTFVATVSGS